MINKEKNKRGRKGFTLVELLAVIVILAIILVIAVPKIMDTIKDATKASLESSAKMVASQVENQYTVAQTLGKEFGDTGSCMQEWSGLNENDYSDCIYEITSNGEAKVTLIGAGKFKGLNVYEATRSSATAIEGDYYTKEECFNFDSDTGTLVKYYLHENNDETQPACPLDVVIPRKINEIEVTKIGGEAFTDCSSDNCNWYSTGLGITSVVIPDSVTEIGNFAFNHNQITNLKLSSNLVTIGLIAFYDNQIRGELDLSNTKLEKMDNYAFAYNQITKVKLPASIAEIDTGAFNKYNDSNPNLTAIINPSGNSFAWNNIIYQGTSDTCTFATGICEDVTITAS